MRLVSNRVVHCAPPRHVHHHLEGDTPCGPSAPSWRPAGRTLVGLGLAVSPTAASNAGSQPERIIDEIAAGDKQVAYNAFQLKGTVSSPQADGTLLPYADQKVKVPHQEGVQGLQVEDRPQDQGQRQGRLQDPHLRRPTGAAGSGGQGQGQLRRYATTKGEKWTLFFD